MKHLLFIASLFAAILLVLPLPARSQKAPIPTKIVEAKTVFLLNQTGDEKYLDAAYEALRKWGRWEIVGDREKADLVLLLILNTSEKAGPAVSFGSATSFPGNPVSNTQGIVIPVSKTIYEYYLQVLDAPSGNPLWTAVADTPQDLSTPCGSGSESKAVFLPSPLQRDCQRPWRNNSSRLQ